MIIRRVAKLFAYCRNGQARFRKQRDTCLEAFDDAHHRGSAQNWRGVAGRWRS